MSRSTRSRPDDRTARAFVRVGWPNLLTRLHRYATATLQLAAIDAGRADVVEAGDLVNSLVEKGLNGTLDWALPEHATDDEVVGYACTKLFGMRSTLRRKTALTARDHDHDRDHEEDDGDDRDAPHERADETPNALALLIEQTQIADVVRAFEHDAEASAYVSRMLAGMTRAEIVAELGCTIEHADVVRKRILRGIAALDARMNDESEDEPPSSGPRGTYHEPQATEERQGAAAEPHRGAGGARRWR